MASESVSLSQYSPNPETGGGQSTQKFVSYSSCPVTMAVLGATFPVRASLRVGPTPHRLPAVCLPWGRASGEASPMNRGLPGPNYNWGIRTNEYGGLTAATARRDHPTLGALFHTESSGRSPEC